MPNDLEMLPNLPHRLRELRQEMGWSLDDVAVRVGVTQRGVVSNWEATNQRRRTPPLTTLLILQKWYGVSLDYLVGHPDAERESPAVKAGRRKVWAAVEQRDHLYRLGPSEKARAILKAAYQLAAEAFFPERVAAVLAITPEDLEGLSDAGVWPDAAIEGLAELTGIATEWFYAIERVKVGGETS